LFRAVPSTFGAAGSPPFFQFASDGLLGLVKSSASGVRLDCLDRSRRIRMLRHSAEICPTVFGSLSTGETMKLGFIGLGRMGSGMAGTLIEQGALAATNIAEACRGSSGHPQWDVRTSAETAEMWHERYSKVTAKATTTLAIPAKTIRAATTLRRLLERLPRGRTKHACSRIAVSFLPHFRRFCEWRRFHCG
jgi:hypothetical protein